MTPGLESADLKFLFLEITRRGECMRRLATVISVILSNDKVWCDDANKDLLTQHSC